MTTTDHLERANAAETEISRLKELVDAPRAALHAALAKAQGEFPAIQREKTVTVKTKDGGSYKFAYATLDQILNAVRPVLSENGLAIVQPLENPGGGSPAIRTMLLHKDGAVLAASFPIPELPSTPQALGSLLTYLRRYALVSMLGLAAEEDDDGNTARASGPATTRDTTDAGPDAEPSGFQAPNVDDVTPHQRGLIFAVRTKLLDAGVLTDQTFREGLAQSYETEHVSELTRKQASDLIERLKQAEERLDRGTSEPDEAGSA